MPVDRGLDALEAALRVPPPVPAWHACGDARACAAKLARRCRPLELTTPSDFQKRFVQNVGLPADFSFASEVAAS